MKENQPKMSSMKERSRSQIVSAFLLTTYLLCLIPQGYFFASTPTSSNNQANSTTNSGLISSSVTTARPNYLETGRQITGILDRFMSLGYDKRVRPNYGGPPVEVNVTMRILSISSVSEVMMDFTADFYFRQTWHDPRLSFKKLGDIQTLYVGAEVSKKIWLPDTFFGNEKLAYFHEATTPNVFLRIDHSGEVYRSIRLTVTSSCPMNLQYFPMDRQRCTIEAESYGYNIKDIIYRWARKETAVERDKEISLPQFDIVKTVQKYRLEELSSGTYSRLIAEIHFARRMGYYLIQIYIPSSLIVVISWVSFWLHRNASPARVQLGVTTVLTMTTLMSSTNAALPKISYVKSIDIFLGTCFIMVFAALLEYATVGYLGKRIAMRKAQVQHAQSQAQARIFAQLQAQGAQGDPIAPAAASTLLGETPVGNFNTNSLLQAAAAAAASGVTPLPPPPPPPLITPITPTKTYNSPNLLNNNNILNSSQQITFDLQQQSFSAAPNNQVSPLLNTDNFNAYLSSLANSGKRDTNPPPTVPERSCNCICKSNGKPTKQSSTINNRCRQHCSASSLNFLSHPHPHNCVTQNVSGEYCAHSNQTSSQNKSPCCCCCGGGVGGKSQTLGRDKRTSNTQTCSHQCQDQTNHINQHHHQHHLHDHHQQYHDQNHHQHHLHHHSHEHENLNNLNNSHTLPRNITFTADSTNNCNENLNKLSNNNSPNYLAADSLRLQQHQQQVNWFNSPSIQHDNNSINNNLPPSYCGKAASAATAAAATFVNLHRRQKGLPPSTNPNFAQFAWMGQHNRSLETIFGIRPSDIDKYSRVVFPVCFVCFQLMYWIVYLHISAFLESEQQQQQPTA